MRRLATVLFLTLAMLTLAAAGAVAHPLNPPGAPNEAPAGLNPGGHGHDGLQCANEAGAPAFPVSLDEVFTCPANG